MLPQSQSFAETVENYEVVSPVVTYPDGKKVSYSGTSPLIAEVYLASVLILFCSGMLSLSQHQLAKMTPLNSLCFTTDTPSLSDAHTHRGTG